MKQSSRISIVRVVLYSLIGSVILATQMVPGLTASSSMASQRSVVSPAGPAGASAQPNGGVAAPLLPPTVIYNSIPGPSLPPNVVSLGYQANQTAEFGDLIQFAGTARNLSTVTLVMSDWALASDWPTFNPSWTHPITLNLYSVNNSGPNPAPGSLLATRTNTFPIPWRPVADPTCPSVGGVTAGTAWRAGDGNCYNGFAFTISFDFTGTTVPNQIIYGVAYNTLTWGYHPIGAEGPYESLNFGLAKVAPTVGTNPFPDTAYWNTATPSNYADGGTGGVSVFRRDTLWTPYSGAISFTTAAVAAPADTCIRDNTTGNFLQWNSTTGDYTFTVCGPHGFTLTGTGKVGLVNGLRTLMDSKPDRAISALFNPGQLTGSANVAIKIAPGVTQNFHLNDTTPHATCTCGT
jgi:hypothetical protein